MLKEELFECFKWLFWEASVQIKTFCWGFFLQLNDYLTAIQALFTFYIIHTN